jgi:hypothetical protein
MFTVERWNDRVEGQDDAGRGDASRTPQCAAPTRAQLTPAPAGSAARGVGRGCLLVFHIEEIDDTSLYEISVAFADS